MRLLYLFVLFVFLTENVWAQRYFKDINPDKVTVNLSDQTITADTRPVKNIGSADLNKFYYWYSGGRIQSTQGSFSGKLLNGNYKSFYLNKNLQEQGEFKKGLKKGEWLSWFEEGRLKEQTQWRKGLKDGEFKQFDAEGRLKMRGRYKKGELDGKIYTFLEKDSVQIIIYSSGKIVTKVKPLKASKLARLGIKVKKVIIKPFKKKAETKKQAKDKKTAGA